MVRAKTKPSTLLKIDSRVTCTGVDSEASPSPDVRSLVGAFEDIGSCSRLNQPLCIKVASYDSDPFTKEVPHGNLPPFQRSNSVAAVVSEAPDSVPQKPPDVHRSESFNQPNTLLDIREVCSSQTVLRPYWKIKQETAFNPFASSKIA